MLVVVCGVPGVGKTSVAEHAAGRLDARLLRTDVVRKEMVEDPEYSDEETWMVYEELFDRSERALRRGEAVVLDGTFHDRRFREGALGAADRADADWRVLKVECDPEVARERIRAREDDASDATVGVHDAFREAFDPVEVDHATIENSGSLPATREQVDEALGALTSVGDGD